MMATTSSAVGPRGDAVARRWWRFGFLAYLLLGAMVVGGGAAAAGIAGLKQFVGLSAGQWNPTIAALVLISLALTLAVLHTARKDIAFLEREERDIEWVLRNPGQNMLLVLIPETARAAVAKTNGLPAPADWRTPTLLSERIRRVYEANARADGTRPSHEQFRFIAESRVGGYGQHTRYAAGLLLLLTVLGTFSGVKAALPALINAASTVGTGVTSRIDIPLNAVAEAFGSNSLALVGAIALGLVAQGFVAGRAAFLKRLEIVSDLHIYGGMSASAVQPLEAATRSLEAAALRLADSQGAFEEIANAIHRLEAATNASTGSLQGALADLGSRADAEFFRHSERLFESVEHRIGRIEEVLAVGVEVYQSVIADVNRRTVETHTAVAALTAVSTRVGSALDRSIEVTNTVADAASAIQQSKDALGLGVTTLHDSLGAMQTEVTALRTTLDAPRKEFLESLEKPIERLRETVERARSGNESNGVRQAIVDLGKLVQQLAESTNRRSERAMPVAGLPNRDASDMGPSLASEMRRFLGELDAVQQRRERRLAIDVVVWSVTIVGTLLLAGKMLAN
jgi:hypothetical protein